MRACSGHFPASMIQPMEVTVPIEQAHEYTKGGAHERAKDEAHKYAKEQADEAYKETYEEAYKET